MYSLFLTTKEHPKTILAYIPHKSKSNNQLVKILKDHVKIFSSAVELESLVLQIEKNPTVQEFIVYLTNFRNLIFLMATIYLLRLSLLQKLLISNKYLETNLM